MLRALNYAEGSKIPNFLPSTSRPFRSYLHLYVRCLSA